MCVFAPCLLFFFRRGCQARSVEKNSQMLKNKPKHRAFCRLFSLKLALFSPLFKKAFLKMWLFLKKNQGWHPCPSTSRLNSSSCFSSRCRNNGEQGRQKQEIALIRDPLPMSGNGACYSPFLPSVGTAESEANVTSAFKCGQSISQPIGQWQPFRHSSYYRK